jgi:DnaJ family protein C protein 27
MPPPQRFKVVIAGDVGIGKTCLIRRFCEGKFDPRYIPTVGVDYGVRALPLAGSSAGVRANFYDTSGSPAYSIVRSEFYKEADGLLLLFDVCDGTALERLDGWVEEAQRCGLRASSPMVLCGTKVDLKGKRAVPQEAVDAWLAGSAAVTCTYHEASSLTGQGVKEVIEALLASCIIENSGGEAPSGTANSGV